MITKSSSVGTVIDIAESIFQKNLNHIKDEIEKTSPKISNELISRLCLTSKYDGRSITDTINQKSESEEIKRIIKNIIKDNIYRLINSTRRD